MCFGEFTFVIDCECSIYILFPLTRNWECSTKTSPFRTSSLEREKKCLESVSELEKSNICNRQHGFGSARIAHLSFQVLSEIAKKRYSSSLKVVQETVRKCRISQKSWCIESDIRNFRDKNGDAWKSFDFFDTQIKTRSGSDYACSCESTLRSVPLLLFDANRSECKMLMQILY